MYLSRLLLITLIVYLLSVLQPLRAQDATEATIARWQETIIPGYSGSQRVVGNLAGAISCDDHGCNTIVPTPQNSVTVYTAAEVRLLFSQRDANIKVARDGVAENAAAMGALGQQVMQALNAATTRIEGQLLTPDTRARLAEEVFVQLQNAIDTRVTARTASLEARLAALETKMNQQR